MKDLWFALYTEAMDEQGLSEEEACTYASDHLADSASAAIEAAESILSGDR